MVIAMIRLHILQGAGVGKAFQTDQDEVLIGRGSDCHWCLPDTGTEKTLSRHHCRISRTGGGYLLSDLSTNGVHVNGAASPLGPGRQHVLEDGDQLRLAMYVMEVRFTQPALGTPSLASSHYVSPFAEPADSHSATLDDPFDPFALVTPPRGGAGPGPEVPEFKVPEAPIVRDPFLDLLSPISDDIPTPPQPAPAPAVVGDSVWQAFLKGAGLPPDAIDSANAEKVMHTTGAICRAMVEGLYRLLETRAALKRAFGVEQTEIDGFSRSNPLKVDMGPERHLRDLLSADPDGLPGDRAVRQAFNDIYWHECATTIATQAMVQHLMKRLDPERLESTVDSRLLHSAVPALRHATLWRAYGEQHQAIADELTQNLRTGISHAYARAYQRALDTRPRGE